VENQASHRVDTDLSMGTLLKLAMGIETKLLQI
jgi:hypothetical protein